MIKKTFKFDAELWFKSKSLRACSPAARGLWLDILCLCLPNGGRLLLNGKPVDDQALSRMVGEPVGVVRKLLAELGEAGIYSVDDKGLYSSKMVKEANFSDQAKVSGARGQRIKKAKAVAPAKEMIDQLVDTIGERKVSPIVKIRKPDDFPPAVNQSPSKVTARSLPWYKSPAGWVRHGTAQAISMNQGEELEDFKFRLACKIPAGPHLDELSEYHKKEVLRQIEQYAPQTGEQRPSYAQDR